MGLVLAGSGGVQQAKLDAFAATLDGRVRETAAAAQARAQTLAQLPRMAYAVATDEDTVLDLTSDELAFRAAPGELIEIGQIKRRSGEVKTLRRVGDLDIAQLPLGVPGQHLLGAGGKLDVVAIVGIDPKEKADELSGGVGVARSVELGTLPAQLGRARVALRIDTHDGGHIVLGRPVDGARAVSLSLVADAAHGATLAALVPASSLPPLGVLIAAACVLVLGLGGAVLSWRRGSTPPPSDDDDFDRPLPDLVPEVHVDLRDRSR